MTKGQAAELLRMAATVHSSILAIGSEEEQTKAWAGLLFDVPFQVALVAMVQHLRTSPYKPVPANIIDIADKLRTSQIQTAELAWQEVVRQYGKRGELHFTSAITYRVVRLMGGISAIAHSPAGYQVADRFSRLYEQLKKADWQDRENDLSKKFLGTEAGAAISQIGEVLTSENLLPGGKPNEY